MESKKFLSVALISMMFLSGTQTKAKSQKDETDSYANFSDLSKEEALKKGREMAESDFAKQVYRLFVVGKRPMKSAYDEYLKVHYGVEVTSIAGCIVSEGILGVEVGYNSTIKPLLNRKFGHDIFKEAEESARNSNRPN